MASTTQKDSMKMDTAVPLAMGSADRAFAEVMRELSQVASGGSMSHMAAVVSAHYPSDEAEADKFMSQLERLRRATESTFLLAHDERNARRTQSR
jgi:hypothetical protein